MRNVTSTVFALGLAAMIPSASVAQTPAEPDPATTFAELALRLPAQSFVVVTDQQGRRLSGRLIGLERDTMSIRAERAVTFTQSEVQHLQRRMPDSVLNGGFIGLAIGMAGPLIVCTSIGDSSETGGCVVGALGFGGLPGFAIGAMVDRLRGRLVTVFRSARANP